MNLLWRRLFFGGLSLARGFLNEDTGRAGGSAAMVRAPEIPVSEAPPALRACRGRQLLQGASVLLSTLLSLPDSC